jgi:hypothetical protein
VWDRAGAKDSLSTPVATLKARIRDRDSVVVLPADAALVKLPPTTIVEPTWVMA